MAAYHNAVKLCRRSTGWKSTGKTLAGDAKQFLEEVGWTAQPVDSAAARRLPVRAVLPKALTYSGRKVSQQQIDSAYAAPAHARASSMGGGFALDADGDSVYVVREGAARDTIHPK